ncbi:hypothetical protein RhiirC2_785906 [Rhizophagus irregularis]|uniref:Uncharacterized protein n=1 Tax=Rhizophagus irregularis TaxID=588596 RepID=A0A2N1MVI6_9GLOM|nr:hypothetical protein RhiirC2_785906 [Rhizophagus irregularis]
MYIPCELEYDLSKFSLENLHKLNTIYQKFCNNNNKYSSSTIENIDNESDNK